MKWIAVLLLAVSCWMLQVQAKGKAASSKKPAKKSDPNDNKGLTPFFLQDPFDQTCLGANGFTQCDEGALWLLTKREGKKTYSLVSFLNPSQSICLQRQTTLLGFITTDQLTLGPCSKNSAKSWDWEFVDQTHVKLSNGGQCLVRGKDGLKSTVAVQSCKKGEFTPLVYHPTAVHENGFYLKAADGDCFDGGKFRSCTGTGSNKLLWGIGIKYIWGEAKRYFFNFSAQERSNCIVAKGNIVEKDTCTSAGALKWGLLNGQLSTNHGNKCVARKVDNTAVLTNCANTYEFILLEVPSLYTNEQLLAMMDNPVS